MIEPWTYRLPPFVAAIIRCAAKVTGTTPRTILSPKRTHVNKQKEVSLARRLIIRELAQHPKQFSTPTIGRWLNIHHTSVLYHLKGWTPPVLREPEPPILLDDLLSGEWQ